MAASATLLPAASGAARGMNTAPTLECPVAFVDGATAGTVPAQDVPLYGGHLSDVGIIFGDTPPDAVTVAIKDKWGATIASGTLAATGRLESFAPRPFVGDLTVVPTGNTTANADFTVILFSF